MVSGVEAAIARVVTCKVTVEVDFPAPHGAIGDPLGAGARLSQLFEDAHLDQWQFGNENLLKPEFEFPPAAPPLPPHPRGSRGAGPPPSL